MRVIKAAVFLFFICLSYADYVTYNDGEYIGISCKATLFKTAIFCKNETAKKYSCQCTNINALGSYVYCGYQNCHSDKEKKQFETFFQSQCPKITTEKMEKAYSNVTSYLVNTTSIANFNISKPVNVPVIYNKKYFGYYLKSAHARYDNFYDSMRMGAGLMGYWGLVFLCGISVNLLSKFAPNLLLKVKKGTSQLTVTRWYRSFVSLPAVFSGRHTQRSALGGVFPTRLESLVLFGFFVLCVLFEATRFHYVAHDVFWSDRRAQMGRYIGDRTAVLLVFMMNITYLFAGRNNIFIWLTGWKQSTFYTYHKWVGRMFLLTIFVHLVAMLCNSIYANLYASRSATSWWRWGSVSGVCGGIIAIQAFSWLRVKNYEFFLCVHILMAVFFLVGAWRHIANFGYTKWAYSTAAVWCFDIFMRLIRIASFGIKDAKIEIVSHETLQVTIEKKSYFPFFSGCFGYIYFVGTPVFWQSHPFTVVKTDNGDLRLYIKIKRGVTETMYKKLQNQPNYTGTIKIALEGPYGDEKPLETYDQVLLYTGGNGIPGPFTYVKKICETEKAKTKFIKLYWVIRHWHSIDWFLEELQSLQKYNNVETVIFVTKYHEAKVGEKLCNRNTSGSNSNSSVNEKNSDDVNEVVYTSWLDVIEKTLPHVEFREGRPSISNLVTEDLQESLGQDVAIVTCAHGDMCDEIRQVVSKDALKRKEGRVDLFEELQTW